MADPVPYILRGVRPIATESSLLVSSSKYLNSARMRDWLAMICLRRNGPDFPLPAELYEMVLLLNELQDRDRIEELFREERMTNTRLDAWFEEGYYSPRLTVADYRRFPAGTVGYLLSQHYGDDFETEIASEQWEPAATQYDFYRRRQIQSHDLEHVLTGGGLDALGELVPAYFRMANLPRFINNQELAGELCTIHVLASLRYTVRTMLHYPQVWTHCLDAIQRGTVAGAASDALFLHKPETLLEMPLDEARAAVGLREVVDRDTSEASAFWERRRETPPAPLPAAHVPRPSRGVLVEA